MNGSSSNPASPSVALREDEEADSFVVHSSGTSGTNDTVKLSSLLLLPEVLQFFDATNMLGMSERVVAAESCWFVAKVKKNKKSLLDRV